MAMINGKLVFDKSGVCYVDVAPKVAQQWNLAGILCLSPPETVARYHPQGKPKKPSNAFFLYKKSKRAELAKQYRNQREFNKFMGEMWQAESEDVKDQYRQLAKEHSKGLASGQLPAGSS